MGNSIRPIVHVHPIMQKLRAEHPLILAGAAATCFGLGGHYLATGPASATCLIAAPWWPDSNITTQSYRHDLVRRLQDAAKSCSKHRGLYVVVTGGKGYGKTTAILTAFAGRIGLVRTIIHPGTTEQEILNNVMGKIAVITGEPRYAGRVMSWFQLLTFGRPLVLVLSVSEVMVGQKYAELTGAVRALADQGHIVIVDASPNSIPPELLTTLRENVVDVDAMTDEEFEHEFNDLISLLEELGYKKLVLSLMGNVPAHAVRLSAKLDSCRSTDDKTHLIEAFVIKELAPVIDLVRTRTQADPTLKEVLQGFRHADQINIPESFRLSSPDKLLRKVLDTSGKYVLVPASASVRFVLFHGIQNLLPAMDKLKNLSELEVPALE